MTALAFFCGIALALAYPRANIVPLAWIAPVPWIAITLISTPRRALVRGFVFGLGFFGLLLLWVQRVLAHFTSLPFFLSAPIWALLIVYLSLYPALFGGVLSWYGRRFGARALLLAPPLWVGLEVARGVALGGFPWGLAGYAHTGGLALLQAARVGGIALVSFLLVAAWSALAALLLAAARGRSAPGGGGVRWPGMSRTGSFAAWAALACVALITGLGAVRLARNPPRSAVIGEPGSGGPGVLEIALIQGGFGGDLDYEDASAALTAYQRLTLEAARTRPGLIVWPESNVPYQPERSPDYLSLLQGLSARAGSPLVLGAVGGTPEAGLTNSAYWIDAAGIRARYDKRRLVQYGEYVPLRGLFPFIKKFVPETGEFLAGKEVGLFALEGRRIGISICYEMIFPDEIRRQALAGAQVLVNLTNDSWYTWGGPWQHAEFTMVRAIETGLWTVRCASTGRTLIIDPFGRVVEHGPLGGEAIVRGSLPLGGSVTDGGHTLSTRLGDWAGTACATLSAAALAFLVVGNIIDKRRSSVFTLRPGDPRP